MLHARIAPAVFFPTHQRAASEHAVCGGVALAEPQGGLPMPGGVVHGRRLPHGAQQCPRGAVGGVQRGRALADWRPLVSGRFGGLAALHPLQDDYEPLNQLFEVEDPVLIGRGGRNMQTCREWRTWRQRQ